jgi:hypothetical protein
MTSEVRSPIIGVLSVKDVRAVFGVKLGAMTTFKAMVLAPDGGMPFVGEVYLARKKSGPGEHIALQCPTCERASLTLCVSEATLKCRACAKRLTRRQREHALPSWREQGGEEHDRILRLLAGRGKTTRSARRRASKLIDELLAADQDRLAAVSELAHAALLASAVFEYELATMPTETDLAFELAVERAEMGPKYWKYWL